MSTGDISNEVQEYYRTLDVWSLGERLNDLFDKLELATERDLNRIIGEIVRTTTEKVIEVFKGEARTKYEGYDRALAMSAMRRCREWLYLPETQGRLQQNLLEEIAKQPGLTRARIVRETLKKLIENEKIRGREEYPFDITEFLGTIARYIWQSIAECFKRKSHPEA